MNPDLAQNLKNLLDGVTDILLYSSIRDYIYARIDYLTEHLLSKNLALALMIASSLLTMWIMIQGFLIVTGRSQENLKSVLFGLGKSYIIILVALGFASQNEFAVRTLTQTLADGVAEIMTGKNEVGSACLMHTENKETKMIISCKIDQNLTLTQGIIGFMDKIDTAESDELKNQIVRAKWFSGVGSAGPGVVSGIMLIMYRIAMSLFIGFGPIFILCLLFRKTAPLFQKWLFYGLSTIFSSVMLAVMADIAMDLTTNVAASLFVTDNLLSTKILKNIGLTEGATGIMSAATQQLGLGLLLSTLLITVPPMAGMWFSGVMGNYSGYNALQGWGGGKPSAMPGHNHYDQKVEQQMEVEKYGLQHSPNTNANQNKRYGNSLLSENPSNDSIRDKPQLGLAGKPTQSQD